MSMKYKDMIMKLKLAIIAGQNLAERDPGNSTPVVCDTISEMTMWKGTTEECLDVILNSKADHWLDPVVEVCLKQIAHDLLQAHVSELCEEIGVDEREVI